ncbi:hypothetical protein ACEWY4_006178 [Coilia grayii]|uniref:PiggyBac transposable element-derived protein domain-containing protein n=1 Tax=Coilia grayii TaxID=363190 RepID=A0ABD1KCP5_9TELE
MPGIRAYWENDTRCPIIADHMARNRFQTLLSSLHFVDNIDLSDRQAEDKCWKIRPWLDMFRKQCLDITPDKHNSIDEQMVPFRGTHSPIRQYVKGKPHPWGLKIWCRCSSCGILKLVQKLLEHQIYFVGTLRSNRLAGCQLEDEKSLAKRGRGSVDAMVEKEGSMVIVRWYDNKFVTLISSYCGTEPQDKARRWSKSDRAFVEANRPYIVKEYNRLMGGTDFLDACVARYKYHMRSRRWYVYLFWQTITLGLVNAWLVYCRDCKLLGIEKPLKHRSFQAEVATSLILVQSQRGRPALLTVCSPPPPKTVRPGVPEDVRTDQIAHWPTKCDTRGRCKVCKVNATTTL